MEDTIFVDDPILNWRSRPHSKFYSGSIEYSFNKEGFRDHEYSRQVLPKKGRIFLASDSVGFGTDVQLEESYPKILEAQLNALHLGISVEVISYSMPGLSLRQKLHLVHQDALSYQPDLIILDYVLNDIEFESRKSLDHGRKASCRIELLHLQVPCELKDTLKDSAVVFFLTERIENLLHQINWEQHNQFYDKVSGDYYLDLYSDPSRQEYLDLTFKEIGAFQSANGIPIIIPIFPLIFDYSQYKWEGIHRRIVQLCEKHGLAYVPLLETYRTYPYNKLRVQRGDFTHPSVLGNRVAAEAIVKTLQKTQLISRLGQLAQ